MHRNRNNNGKAATKRGKKGRQRVKNRRSMNETDRRQKGNEVMSNRC